ncbi:hypothetical protein CRENBAI_011331 [Crenichthys baileyi]|uniref:Uncharacterized protein n=1 Tax=Crenichthys baileyi TaxID=28760 RepID=A0AAV9RKL4_9TELE
MAERAAVCQPFGGEGPSRFVSKPGRDLRVCQTGAGEGLRGVRPGRDGRPGVLKTGQKGFGGVSPGRGRVSRFCAPGCGGVGTWDGAGGSLSSGCCLRTPGGEQRDGKGGRCSEPREVGCGRQIRGAFFAAALQPNKQRGSRPRVTAAALEDSLPARNTGRCPRRRFLWREGGGGLYCRTRVRSQGAGGNGDKGGPVPGHGIPNPDPLINRLRD